MRLTCVILILSLTVSMTGCAIPSYLIEPQNLALAPSVPATREADGKRVWLQAGSFMPTPDGQLADKRVRVRGPGRHGALWKAGAIVTLGGLVLSALGLGLGFGGFGLSTKGCGDITEHPCYDSMDPSLNRERAAGDAMFTSSLVIGPIGYAALFLVGPALWIAGARQAPREEN
jgi:hypothetical protein